MPLTADTYTGDNTSWAESLTSDSGGDPGGENWGWANQNWGGLFYTGLKGLMEVQVARERADIMADSYAAIPSRPEGPGAVAVGVGIPMWMLVAGAVVLVVLITR
jgi:hypothetical protein